jgi:hypothetical protein
MAIMTTGGMVGFLAATQGKRKPKLPLYIGGERYLASQAGFLNDPKAYHAAMLNARRKG